jgi:predicted transcriptional regulator
MFLRVPLDVYIWIDNFSKLGIRKNIIVTYAIKQLMKRDKKELLKDILLNNNESIRLYKKQKIILKEINKCDM